MIRQFLSAFSTQLGAPKGKVGLMLGISLASLVVIFSISAYQLANLGNEAEKLILEDMPMNRLISEFDRDVFRQSALLRQAWQFRLDGEVAETNPYLDKYHDQLELLSKNQSVLTAKMLQYVRQRVPANTRIQGIQKEKLLQSTEVHLNAISRFLQQYFALSETLFQKDSAAAQSPAWQVESGLSEFDRQLHEVIRELFIVVSKAVAQTDDKINHTRYGAIQLIAFVLYWLLFISLLYGVWVIRKLPSSS